MTTQTLLLLIVLGLAGCGSIGPGTVTRDRFDYSSAVAESWKSQMLMNLVKLRYGDTPVFLDVGQIISGYTMEGTLSAIGTLFSAPGVVPGVPDSSVGLGAQGRYTDRPTITYAPLVGERFARAMMTPLPPPAILSLIQAGYPVDAVLRLAVHEVNGLRNRYGGDLKPAWGVPVKEIQLGIRHGVRKINVDTDSRLAVTGAIRKVFAETPEKFDPRDYLKPARAAMQELIAQRMRDFGQTGHAGDYEALSLEDMREGYAAAGAAA